MAGEILWRAQRIVARDEFWRADREHILLEQQRRREAFKLARAPADERVGCAGFERAVDRIGVDQHICLGMARLEFANPPDEPGRGERRRRIDDEEAAPLALAHRPRGLREQHKPFRERRGPRRARFRQPQPAAASLHEPCANRLFERAHLLCDGGLGDMQFLPRASERQVARHRLEGAQRVQRRQSMEEVHSFAGLYHRRRKNDFSEMHNWLIAFGCAGAIDHNPRSRKGKMTVSAKLTSSSRRSWGFLGDSLFESNS